MWGAQFQNSGIRPPLPALESPLSPKQSLPLQIADHSQVADSIHKVFHSSNVNEARKRHININFFVRLVLGRPRACPGDFTGFVPGTNPVKTWDKPGVAPYFTQWKPGKPGFVPGTNPVRPWDNPRTKGGTESLCDKS